MFENDDKRVLQIDHINGGGYRHRKITGCCIGYYQDILRSIKKGSKKYRILCGNCNYIEGIRLGVRSSIWT